LPEAILGKGRPSIEVRAWAGKAAAIWAEDNIGNPQSGEKWTCAHLENAAVPDS
jgi:mannose-6-phosphate isomerase class I